MNNNIFEKKTNQLAETIDTSVALALHNKKQEVEVIHLLWALLTNTNLVLNQLLNNMNVNKAAIELEAKSNA
ncbi:Clp protease N-terminal domain-containing protein, partial [Aliarcobacter butzleri]|uniref:Clp protease N-terminal domain-containing protein n=1 Tax=Aliarcobacter butzleri TaxID=28197 RepID=UPI003B226BE8